MAFNTSKDYLQIDIKTTCISAMNYDEKILHILKKWVINEKHNFKKNANDNCPRRIQKDPNVGRKFH